jgi:hypothetical protein
MTQEDSSFASGFPTRGNTCPAEQGVKDERNNVEMRDTATDVELVVGQDVVMSGSSKANEMTETGKSAMGSSDIHKEGYEDATKSNANQVTKIQEKADDRYINGRIRTVGTYHLFKWPFLFSSSRCHLTFDYLRNRD